ncbi:protein VASCULATURE COMPLEXITY AND CONNECTIVITY-like [Castanea sativa]|uniref:protein VASCULATURE COMPLEXITY AND CONNECTIVITY-like n=1 Tax=Castanea sativa TaxID=21020 RepID=UPI003F64B716
MELRVVVICAVIGVLGLSSVIMGFVAERTRIKVSQVTFDGFNCVRPHSPATALGLVALPAIILAQIIVSVATGCICCCKRGSHPNSCNWIIAQVCFVFSWITVVIAAVVLLLASSYNSSTSNYDSNGRCYVTKPGVFAGGAILCLVSVVLGLASYILSLQKNSNNRFQGDMAMAQPQFAGGTSIYQGATPIGQPQYQWGNPAVPNQGDMPMGHTKFPQ